MWLDLYCLVRLRLTFLLTHPVWDVTRFPLPFCLSRYFYSHIPCGMWLRELLMVKRLLTFLLTHPVWDVTILWFNLKTTRRISTHTSRVGCDSALNFLEQSSQISTHTSRVGCDESLFCFLFEFTNFYSHIPCGMWQGPMRGKHPLNRFLLTHPVWDVTNRREAECMTISISTHTSRVGCDDSW